MKAFIWRKSIYDNDYVCRCGKELMKNGNVVDDMLFNTETNELICPKCGLNVAKETTEIEALEIGAFRSEKA